MAKAKAKPKAQALQPVNEKQEFSVLYRRCESKNATSSDRAALRSRLDEKPEAWRDTANMLRSAQARIIEDMNGNGVVKEFASFGCDQLRRELSYLGDTAMEKALIDVAVLSWLQLGLIQQHYSGVWATEGGISYERGIFWEKRLSAAQRRFERAIVSLARVRKLMRPKAQSFTGAVSRDAQGNGLFNQTLRMSMAHIFEGRTVEEAKALTSRGVLPKSWDKSDSDVET